MTDITPLALPDVLLIRRPVFRDARGAFCATWSRQDDLGDFVQDNVAASHRAGTLRGLHFQAPPHAQAKLIGVLAGAVFDVAVDIRKGSATFGQWVGRRLSADNGEQMLIPAGFAHGYLTLTDNAVVSYKVDGGYAPDAEGGLLWNDPVLGIEWPVERREVVINARDASYPGLANLNSPF